MGVDTTEILVSTFDAKRYDQNSTKMAQILLCFHTILFYQFDLYTIHFTLFVFIVSKIVHINSFMLVSDSTNVVNTFARRHHT